MLFKILLFAAVVAAVYFFFIKKKPLPPKEDETMVACTKCGTFVSTKEAIIKDGRFYCSKECAEVK